MLLPGCRVFWSTEGAPELQQEEEEGSITPLGTQAAAVVARLALSGPCSRGKGPCWAGLARHCCGGLQRVAVGPGLAGAALNVVGIVAAEGDQVAVRDARIVGALGVRAVD